MEDDLSQYVVVADPQECLGLAEEASRTEQAAMELDGVGEFASAVDEYRRAAAKLHEAAEVCPDGHPDGSLIRQHAHELSARAGYLELLDGTRSVEPVHNHVRTIQLSLGSPEGLPEEGGPGAAQRGSPWDAASQAAKVRGAAAVIGGAAGLLVLGPLAGVAAGVATAVATTHEGQAGAAAKRVGGAGVQLIDGARRLNREHRISDRVVSASSSAIETTTAQARQKLAQIGDGQRILERLRRGLGAPGARAR